MRIAAALLESYERQVQSVEGALKVFNQSPKLGHHAYMSHVIVLNQPAPASNCKTNPQTRESVVIICYSL